MERLRLPMYRLAVIMLLLLCALPAPALPASSLSRLLDAAGAATPPEQPVETRRESTRLPARPAVPPDVPEVNSPVAPSVVSPPASVSAPEPASASNGTAAPPSLGAKTGKNSTAAGNAAVTGPALTERARSDDAAADELEEDAAGRGSARDSGAKGPWSAPPLPAGRELELQQRGIVRAEVRPSRPYLLTLPFSGTVASVEVYDGELVKKDQLLAVLDKAAAERGLEEARKSLQEALEQVQGMRWNTEADREAAQELLARRADALQAAEERLAMTGMKASFDGRVTEIRARAGQHLHRGEVVMELAEEGDLEVVSEVPSAWVSRLREGNVIWVFVEETGKSYEAAFVRFGGKVNAASRSIRAYARFVSTPAELLPGMSGRANFFPPAPR